MFHNVSDNRKITVQEVLNDNRQFVEVLASVTNTTYFDGFRNKQLQVITNLSNEFGEYFPNMFFRVVEWSSKGQNSKEFSSIDLAVDHYNGL